MIRTAKTQWLRILSIWALSLVCAAIAAFTLEPAQAFAWFGAILAGSMALVSMFHLVKAAVDGFVKELIYVAGGSYLILAIASIYLFIAR
ncbi:MAG: hypothetical protein ACKOWE_03655 [Micrococcales bacterium]